MVASSQSFLRMFIAVDLPDKYKAQLEDIQNKLKTFNADIKWVEPKNFHITLKFLGDTLSSQIKTVTGIMDACAENTPSFSIKLAPIGAFPTARRPEIIWIGLDKESEELNHLATTLQEELLGTGFSKETKPFHAHVTIGRARSNRNAHILSSAITTLNIQSMTVDIRHLTLVQSVLSSDGAQYSQLHRSHLK